MSKTQFKDIKHFFTVTPDNLEVKGFADGVEGKLEISWQHPMLHTDEDDEQPAEGANHIRIEVKTDWLPFDPTQPPIAEHGHALLIKDTSHLSLGCFDYFNGRWVDYNCKDLNPTEFKDKLYKLIRLW